MNFSIDPQLRGTFKSPFTVEAALRLLENLLEGRPLDIPDWENPTIEIENGDPVKYWHTNNFEARLHHSVHIPDSDDYAYNWAAARSYYYRLTAFPFDGATGLLMGNNAREDGFTYYWIYGKQKPAADLKKRILYLVKQPGAPGHGQ